MNVLLIPDSFKGSLSSKDVIAALEMGFNKIDTSINVFSCIASDGGEGFLETIEKHENVDRINVSTVDPIGRIIDAPFLFDHVNATAYVELAKASGYELLLTEERNPMFTSTAGTGKQIKRAIELGAKTVYIGLGGSATNDGGIGMASELGFNFLDERGRIIQPIGSNLSKIAKINGHLLYPKTKFIAINDVNNILYGENGAALNYAKQKGASTKETLYLESGLRHLDQIVIAQLGKNVADTPGAGAAGGSGYGIKIFMNGSFISGNDFFFKIAKIKALIEREKIDFIITGEGSIDSLSLKGKLIQGIVKMAKPAGVMVIAICGKLDLTAAEVSQMGLYFVTPIAPKGISTEESIQKASQYITYSVKRILQKMKSR